MEPRIETLTAKKLIGRRTKMSFAVNKTFELWRGFMPHRAAIGNAVGTELYSVEVYPPLFFDNFDPGAEFEKWAAVEVTDLEAVPAEMETIVIPEGLYAVFRHRGPASAGPQTYGYIFGTWLPASAFLLDERPHLAVMGEKYRNDAPDSEEDLWIPIRAKS